MTGVVVAELAARAVRAGAVRDAAALLVDLRTVVVRLEVVAAGRWSR